MKTLKLLLLGFALAGCSASVEKPFIHAALADPALRAKTFEATARELDEHPAYVDEFYQVSRRHPPASDRFMMNSARDLHEVEIARKMAQLLAEKPDSLQRILVETVDATRPHPKARAAFDRALVERHAAVADILTDSPEAVQTTMEFSIDQAMKKNGAREALLNAMRARASELADILIHDPNTLHAVLDAIIKRGGNDKIALKAILESLKPE